jgi:hypothetical protein
LTVSLGLTVEYVRSVPDIEELTKTIARAVNLMSLDQQSLTASFIVAAAQSVLGDTARIQLPFGFMRGVARQPDGTTVSYDDPFNLDVVSDVSQGASGRTTAFFLDPGDITITLSEISEGEF